MDKQSNAVGPRKCKIRDGSFVEPCELLNEATEYGNPRGNKKGIFSWSYHDINGPTRIMFGSKSGKHSKTGILFNFCPFCGTRIDKPFAKRGSH